MCKGRIYTWIEISGRSAGGYGRWHAKRSRMSWACKTLSSTWTAALYFYMLACGLPVKWRLVRWHLQCWAQYDTVFLDFLGGIFLFLFFEKSVSYHPSFGMTTTFSRDAAHKWQISREIMNWTSNHCPTITLVMPANITPYKGGQLVLTQGCPILICCRHSGGHCLFESAQMPSFKCPF